MNNGNIRDVRSWNVTYAWMVCCACFCGTVIIALLIATLVTVSQSCGGGDSTTTLATASFPSQRGALNTNIGVAAAGARLNNNGAFAKRSAEPDLARVTLLKNGAAAAAAAENEEMPALVQQHHEQAKRNVNMKAGPSIAERARAAKN